jgi:hypothetical protein
MFKGLQAKAMQKESRQVRKFFDSFGLMPLGLRYKITNPPCSIGFDANSMERIKPLVELQGRGSTIG